MQFRRIAKQGCSYSRIIRDPRMSFPYFILNSHSVMDSAVILHVILFLLQPPIQAGTIFGSPCLSGV